MRRRCSSRAIRRCSRPCALRSPASDRLARRLVAEHADEHAGAAQVGACPTSVTVTNPTRGSASSAGEHVGKDLADRLIDTAHALGGHRGPAADGSGELALDLARLVGLEHVAVLDVLEVVQHDAALEAGRDLAHVLVEAAQARDRRLVDDRASRTTRTFAPRVTFPSVTKQPAIVPMREARNVWRTSACPIVSSTSSGSSMPCIAARSSSIAR